jgi:hypothetical protein
MVNVAPWREIECDERNAYCFGCGGYQQIDNLVLFLESIESEWAA